MNNRPSNNPNTFSDMLGAMQSVIREYMVANIFTVDIVEVVSYQNEFLSVKPVLMNQTTSGEIIPIKKEDIIHNVCMMTLSGAGCEISINSEKGDKGLLIACKGDISNYKKTKKDSAIGSMRRFSNSNGVFIPLDFTNKGNGVTIKNKESIINVLDNEISIKGGNIKLIGSSVNIESSDINLGGSGGVGVALMGGEVINPSGAVIGTIKSGSTVTKSL